VPPPVNPYLELPRWLHRRIKEKIPKQEVDTSGGGRPQSVTCRSNQPRSQNRRTPAKKLVAFVAEPYGLDAGEMRSIIHIAERLDLRFDIRAGSSHYPTRALRITFWPPEVTRV
jgi:hypothetical protein